MRSCILCVHKEISSLWAEFVNNNRCIRVCLVSYDQNILLIFLCERWIPCQVLTSVLCLHYRPETVNCSTKDVYTTEITFLPLHPCLLLNNKFVFASFLDIFLSCFLHSQNLSKCKNEGNVKTFVIFHFSKF